MISFDVFHCRALVAAVLLSMTASVALAGMETSLEKEFRRIDAVRRQVESLPAYQQSEELKQKISILQAQMKTVARDPNNTVEVVKLRAQIGQLKAQLAVATKMIADFREAIGDSQSERFFPGVSHRLAVFTYDDPHATALGDSVSFLLSKRLLFSTRVTSFAVVNYRQGAARDTSNNLAYFDRVDAVTRDQNYALAAWGRLSRNERGVQIDSFLQVPSDADTSFYVRTLTLPKAMGSGELTVRLKPDRILLQSIEIDAEGARLLGTAADQVATLRASPAASAAVTGHLGQGGDRKTYTIIGSDRDWVRLQLSDGSGGWTSIDRFCTGACRSLLDVADFANDILAIRVGLPVRPIRNSLTRESAAMSQQLVGLVALPQNPNRAAELAGGWARGDASGKTPGGAGFANLLAVARINAELKRASASQTDFDRIRLSNKVIEQIAGPLVEASIADPGDVDVVENLAVLFAYLGDERRRGLALEIASSLKARSR